MSRYTKGQHFREHFDWFDTERMQGDSGLSKSGNRATSFFAYLVADCVGGTTVFPKVPRPAGDAWCETVVCSNDDGQNVTRLEVKAKVGTALFWHNLDANGIPDEGTLHAGMPVTDGIKVGLNVWTREKQFRF